MPVPEKGNKKWRRDDSQIILAENFTEINEALKSSEIENKHKTSQVSGSGIAVLKNKIRITSSKLDKKARYKIKYITFQLIISRKNKAEKEAMKYWVLGINNEILNRGYRDSFTECKETYNIQMQVGR